MTAMEPPTPDEIRTVRKGLGLTQSSFADALGVSLRTVEEWEAGRNVPPPYLRLALVTLLAGAAP
jgi:DNA-binding transcriptional regulator YiaG